MRNKYAISLILVLILGLFIGEVFVKYTIPDCDNTTKVDSNENKNDILEGNNDVVENDNNNEEKSDIVYKTFSSSNADFTFEYPDTWVYEEMENNDTKVWRFYSESDNDHNGIPYLEIQTPILDSGAINFSTGEPNIERGETLRPYHYSIYVFATNDPGTFVTYQWNGNGALENGSGYIYWEKGQYFANSSYLYGHKYNYIRVYSIPENGQEIGLHIAQSITIK